MPRPNRERDARLAELYAQIPQIECKGECWPSCGPISMSRREDQRIRAAGVRVPPWKTEITRDEITLCPALTDTRQCRVYEIRPLICRLWGVVDSLPCFHGCRPERYLSDATAFLMIGLSMDIGGTPAAMLDGSTANLALALADPNVRAALSDFLAAGSAKDRLRAVELR